MIFVSTSVLYDLRCLVVGIKVNYMDRYFKANCPEINRCSHDCPPGSYKDCHFYQDIMTYQDPDFSGGRRRMTTHDVMTHGLFSGTIFNSYGTSNRKPAAE